MNLSDEAQLTPIPLDKAISSLSAILLDDGYYGFIHNFKIDIEDIPTIPPEIIIPLKARAWLDLTERRQTGEHVDKFDIKKHKNDIFRLKLKDGRFCLSRELIEHGGTEAARKAFEQFYTDKGQQRFEARAVFFAPKVGVTVAGIKVKDMGFRWASCGRSGTLRFHWKCMMAPPRIIDYITVHELCHLHHRNHTDAFWNEVDKVLPDWRERKEWLRRRWAGLDL